MNYPISTTDLAQAIAEDDEQATLIVIEALESQTSNELVFTDESSRPALIERVKNWNRYDEFSALIANEKKLLVAPLGSDHNNVKDLNKLDLLDANAITNRAISAREKESRSKKRYQIFSSISVAAALVFVVLGFVVITQITHTATGHKSASSSTRTTHNKAENTAPNEGARPTQSPIAQDQLAQKDSADTTTISTVSPAVATVNSTTRGNNNSIASVNSEDKTGVSSSEINHNVLIAILLFVSAIVLMGSTITIAKRKQNKA